MERQGMDTKRHRWSFGCAQELVTNYTNGQATNGHKATQMGGTNEQMNTLFVLLRRGKKIINFRGAFIIHF